MSNIENHEVITAMGLFEYIDALMTKPEVYKRISNSVKSQHFFMLQRRLAIRYPDIVNIANISGIDAVAISDMYHAKLQTERMPKWLYTKTPKNAIELHGAPLELSKEYVETICSVYQLDRKTYESIALRRSDWLMSIVEMIDRSHKGRVTKSEANEY